MKSKNTTPDMNTEIISTLYKQVTGQQHDNIELLTGSGSNRQYFRMTGIRSLIAVRGESIAENRAFIYMARHFRSKGIPVPEVLAVSDDESCYIQEDLGDTLLFNAISNDCAFSIMHNPPTMAVPMIYRFIFINILLYKSKSKENIPDALQKTP